MFSLSQVSGFPIDLLAPSVSVKAIWPAKRERNGGKDKDLVILVLLSNALMVLNSEEVVEEYWELRTMSAAAIGAHKLQVKGARRQRADTYLMQQQHLQWFRIVFTPVFEERDDLCVMETLFLVLLFLIYILLVLCVCM